MVILYFYQYFHPKSVGRPVKFHVVISGIAESGQVEVDGVQDQAGSDWCFGMEHWCITRFVESGQMEVDGVQDQANSTGFSVFSQFLYFIIIFLIVYSATKYHLVESSCRVLHH